MEIGLYDFYKYESLLKDESKFLKEVELQCAKSGVYKAVRILKLSGVVVNPFNNKRNEKVLKCSLEIIERFAKGPNEKLLIDKLRYDKKMIESVYERINRAREKKYEELLPNKKYERNTYLINLELILRSFNKWLNDVNKFKDVDQPKFPQSEIDNYEHIVETCSNVFKYFDYRKYDQKNIHRIFNEKSLKMANEHINLNWFWKEIDYFHDYWKYADLAIEVDDNRKLKVDFYDDEFDLITSVSDHRAKSLNTNQQMEIQNELNFNRFISEDSLYKNISREYLFSFFINPAKFYSESIPLSRWLEAYELLQEECKKKIKEHYLQLNMNNLLLIKKKSEWVNFFVKNDFTREESTIIIKQFTFHSQSTDFIDYPFIPFGDFLVVIPSLTEISIGGHAISSNFLNEKVQLQSRGHEFESSVIELLNSNGIKARKLVHKTNDTEYECDVAFQLDQDIYLVECKAHIQPFKLRQHASHLNKLEDDVKQLDRIADYYSQNLDLIKKQLSLSEDFSINNIYRVVLTTSMQGSNQRYGETFVVDNSSFRSMILRRRPSLKISNTHKIDEYHTEDFVCYQGSITSEKMIEYLGNPPQIHLTRKFFEKVEGQGSLAIVKKYKSQAPILEFSKDGRPSSRQLNFLKA
ncbi:hypothetical protein [Exiguobacterium sp. S3]|uniref:hypothetical protein n=1 Tax=Exiguobacterium sp. S3 TaxID=483245 RepID=UPI001BEB7B1B|nr:hypothetical protein [Exiguobacterium sp. S3]